GGLGLGLTLVRGLVEMHGGTVQATSEGLGQGSEFVVKLPVWKPEEQQPKPAAGPDRGVAERGRETAAARPTIPGRNVLVVDDNVTWAQSLALLLSLEGHEAQVVHDGPSALEAPKNFGHDVVFMDIGLPGMDGYEVARRIRREVGHSRPLLVAI